MALERFVAAPPCATLSALMRSYLRARLRHARVVAAMRLLFDATPSFFDVFLFRPFSPRYAAASISPPDIDRREVQILTERRADALNVCAPFSLSDRASSAINTAEGASYGRQNRCSQPQMPADGFAQIAVAPEQCAYTRP